jgi:hypothetical protein
MRRHFARLRGQGEDGCPDRCIAHRKSRAGQSPYARWPSRSPLVVPPTTARNKSDWLRVWNHQQIMPALALEPAMAAATDVPSIFFLKKCLTS